MHIFRRGNQFEISGKQDECRLAATVLQSLYSHLESGKVLEPGDTKFLEVHYNMQESISNFF